MRKSFLAVLFALTGLLTAVSGCTYPNSKVEQGGPPSGIYFVQAPEAAQVYVDGESAGLAADFDGSERALAVSPGRHVVELKIDGTSILRQDIYVGDGTLFKIDAR